MSLARTGPHPPRARLWAELLALFVAVPFGLRWIAERGHVVPVIPVLLLCAPLAWLAVRRRWRPNEDLRRARRTPRSEWRRIARTFAVAGALLALYVLLVERDRLLDLPRERPGLWALILLGYPLLSVVPQELIYRALFFLRYGPLFPSAAVRVAASGLAFGLVHVIFGNALAVLLSTAGGVLFGVTWTRTRSLAVTSAEHALYGCLLFTIGLGRYFYAGAA